MPLAIRRDRAQEPNATWRTRERDPRELVSLPGGHREPKRVEIVRRLVDLALTRVTGSAAEAR